MDNGARTMEYLAEFVNKQNRWNKIYDGEAMDLSKLDDALAQKLFGMLEGELSPENLCCDGELSYAKTLPTIGKERRQEEESVSF